MTKEFNYGAVFGLFGDIVISFAKNYGIAIAVSALALWFNGLNFSDFLINPEKEPKYLILYNVIFGCILSGGFGLLAEEKQERLGTERAQTIFRIIGALLLCVSALSVVSSMNSSPGLPMGRLLEALIYMVGIHLILELWNSITKQKWYTEIPPSEPTTEERNEKIDQDENALKEVLKLKASLKNNTAKKGKS